jgi:molybdenum cofactor cytidylyltransferase
MGRSKLTLELGGATFLERAIRAASEAESIGRCFVVVRPEDLHLVGEAASVANGKSVEAIANPDAMVGQSASVVIGAQHAARDPACEAVIYVVVDQPFLNGAVFDTLTRAYAENKGEILVSTYDGELGNPVLFARHFFDELTQLTGDVGGRSVVRAHPEVVAQVPMPDPRAGRDIDTWEDYESARAHYG